MTLNELIEQLEEPENPCMVCGEECSGPFEQDPEDGNGFEGDFWAYCERCDAWTSYPRESGGEDDE